ncbi:MAG: hypothetical protein HUU35_14925 [Armatimonadetes bacterium]|nr:hypothetical protein [Armatimonadota bacterium]
MATCDRRRRGPTAPAALKWAVLFNLLHISGGVSFGWFIATADLGRHTPERYVPVVLLGGLVSLYAAVLFNLRRGCAWAWVAQLVLICLVVALSSIPGLLWVPLLVAWCSPTVRDWFDPPLRREFG